MGNMHFTLCDDSKNGRQADLSGYPGPERLLHPHPHPRLAFSGEPCSWILSREYGVALADIARQLGVCTSATAKAVLKKEGRIKGVIFPLRPPFSKVDAGMDAGLRRS